MFWWLQITASKHISKHFGNIRWIYTRKNREMQLSASTIERRADHYHDRETCRSLLQLERRTDHYYNKAEVIKHFVEALFTASMNICPHLVHKFRNHRVIYFYTYIGKMTKIKLKMYKWNIQIYVQPCNRQTLALVTSLSSLTASYYCNILINNYCSYMLITSMF